MAIGQASKSLVGVVVFQRELIFEIIIKISIIYRRIDERDVEVSVFQSTLHSVWVGVIYIQSHNLNHVINVV